MVSVTAIASRLINDRLRTQLVTGPAHRSRHVVESRMGPGTSNVWTVVARIGWRGHLPRQDDPAAELALPGAVWRAPSIRSLPLVHPAWRTGPGRRAGDVRPTCDERRPGYCARFGYSGIPNSRVAATGRGTMRAYMTNVARKSDMSGAFGSRAGRPVRGRSDDAPDGVRDGAAGRPRRHASKTPPAVRRPVR
jgi:hypothetical protein